MYSLILCVPVHYVLSLSLSLALSLSLRACACLLVAAGGEEAAGGGDVDDATPDDIAGGRGAAKGGEEGGVDGARRLHAEARGSPSVESTLDHEHLAEALRGESLGDLGRLGAVGVQDENLGGLLDALERRHLDGGEVILNVAHVFEVTAELLARNGDNLVGVTAGELDLTAGNLVVATDVADDNVTAGEDGVIRFDGTNRTGVASDRGGGSLEEHRGEQVRGASTGGHLDEVGGSGGGEEVRETGDDGGDALGGVDGDASSLREDRLGGLNVDALRLDGILGGEESGAGGALDNLLGVDDDRDDGTLGVPCGSLLDGSGGVGDAVDDGLHDGSDSIDGGADLLEDAGDGAKGTLHLVRGLVDAVEDGEEVLFVLCFM